MIRIALSLCVAAFPVAGQIQSTVFDPSGNSSITALRAGPNGDLIIAGAASGGGIPLVNAFQSRFASSGMKITRDGGRTWQMGQRPIMKDSFNQLVVDPKDANTVYALGNKGIYRSADATETWQKLADLPLSQLLIDTHNTLTMYARGTGVFKSTDGGTTWRALTFPDVVPVLTLDPFRSGTVYASTFERLYRSTDGGDSWTNVALPDLAARAQTVVFDPSRPGLVYVRAGGSFPSIAWWRSKDNMATWVRLPQPHLQYLGVDPLHSGVLYAEDDSGYAIKSDDAGDSWKQLNKAAGAGPLGLIPGSPPALFYSLYASYDGGATWTSSPFPLGPGNTIATLAYAPSAPGVAYFVTESPGSNAFVARLDSSGQQIRFSTLLGGPGGAVATAVETDAFANTYLAGNVSSNDFPTTPGAAQTALISGFPLQGFLAKFDSGGNLLWSTLTPSQVSSIAVDGDDSVVTLSQNGIQRVSPNGDRIDAIPSSALNTRSYPTRLVLAPNGNIAVVGVTRMPFGTGLPSYLIWMDPFGSTISKTTFASSSVSAVEVDASGAAVIAGATLFEVGGTPGAYQSAPLGGCPYGPAKSAAFVARISQAGEIVSSTLLGGQCGDSASTLALAPDGDAIVTHRGLQLRLRGPVRPFPHPSQTLIVAI